MYQSVTLPHIRESMFDLQASGQLSNVWYETLKTKILFIVGTQ
jgi:hypothetical protein